MGARTMIIIILVTLFLHYVPSGTTTTPRSSSPVGILRSRSGFGEACNKTIRCRSQSWLACDPETAQCGCAQPDEMIYDSTRGKCVGLIGERCKFGFGTDDESLESFYEKAECVRGAVCEDGVCSCPFGTFDNIEENKCSNVKSRGTSCKSSDECDQKAFLNCIEGQCQCLSKDMVYDDQVGPFGQCRIKAGKMCPLATEINGTLSYLSQDESNCVHGSLCLGDLSSSSTFQGVCTCNSGLYRERVSDLCVPVKSRSLDCILDEECDSAQMLNCVDKICDCNPEKSVYLKQSYQFEVNYGSYYQTVTEGTCVSKVGSSCLVPGSQYEEYERKPADGWKYCLLNGVCESNICFCKSGFFPTSDNLCGLGYDRTCSSTDICSDKYKCMEEQRGGSNGGMTVARCRCPSIYSQIYENGVCKGFVGGPCDPTAAANVTCVKNAQCVEVEGTEGAFVCECESGYVENSGQRCDVDYNHPCDKPESPPCAAGLGCAMVGTGFRCVCPNEHHVYEKELRKCSSVVGFSCLKDEDCVTNAVCVKPPMSSRGRCRCQSGFIYSKQMTKCVPDFISNEGEVDAFVKEIQADTHISNTPDGY